MKNKIQITIMSGAFICLMMFVLLGNAEGDKSQAAASKDKDDVKKVEKAVAVKVGDKAPDWSAKDTNPSSPSNGKKLSPKDFKGKASIWIATFDCDC